MGCAALEPTQRLVLLALETFADFTDGTGARPGWAALANIVGISRSQTLDAMRIARDLNLIQQTARGARKLGHADTYRLVPVPVSRSTGADLQDDFKVHSDPVSRSTGADPTVSTTVRTPKEPLRGSKSGRESASPRTDADTDIEGSQTVDTANTSDTAHPGMSEEQQPREDETMKPDPNQDGIPGMLISLPNRTLEPEPEPADAPAPNSRGTRLPEDWMPPPEVIAQMRGECPNVDQELEFRKFRDYWLDKTGKDATKRTWVGTYRNWIRKAGEGSRAGRNGQPIATSDLRVAQIQALKAKFANTSHKEIAR